MVLDINWLLEQRKVLNEQFITIISNKYTAENLNEDLAEFCSTLTDYLTASVLKLGPAHNLEYAANFSDKYANGTESESSLRKDLSGLILMMSEHWNREDALIKKFTPVSAL